MTVHRFALGPLATNCYLLVCEKTNKGLVVDPADDGDFVSNKIFEFKTQPLFIVATHGHFDHIMAVEELRVNFKAPFLIHKKDEFLVKTAKKRAEFWQIRTVFLPPKKWRYIKEGDDIVFGEKMLVVLETPGHTPGSICLYSKEEGLLFSGDLIFKDGIGRADFSYSSQQALEESLRRVYSLGRVLVYPGHGEDFVIG